MTVYHDEGAQEARAQHVCDGIERKVWIQELGEEEYGHDQPEERHGSMVRNLACLVRPPNDGLCRMPGSQKEQQYLGSENDVPGSERMVDTVRVHRKEDRCKDVHDDEHADRCGEDATGMQ